MITLLVYDLTFLNCFYFSQFFFVDLAVLCWFLSLVARLWSGVFGCAVRVGGALVRLSLSCLWFSFLINICTAPFFVRREREKFVRSVDFGR